MLVISTGEFMEEQDFTPEIQRDTYMSVDDLDDFITGEELIERLKPRIKSLFENI